MYKSLRTENYVQKLAASKSQADFKILAASENQADCKILAASENQADGKILAGVEIPAPGELPALIEKLAELEKQAACILFRLGGISNCWLLPGAADKHVFLLIDVMNLACSLQVRREPCRPAFMGGLSPVLYCLYRLAMPRNGPNPRGNQKSGFRLEFHWFLSKCSSLYLCSQVLYQRAEKFYMITIAAQCQQSHSQPLNWRLTSRISVYLPYYMHVQGESRVGKGGRVVATRPLLITKLWRENKGGEGGWQYARHLRWFLLSMPLLLQDDLSR